MTPRILGSAMKLLLGATLFGGLPLLGWGVNDLSGFVRNPARLAYLLLVLALQLGLIVRFPDIGGTGKEGQVTVPQQRRAVFLLQVLSISIVIVAPYADRWGILAWNEAGLVRYIGLAIFSVGFILVNWAEASLGGQFSVQVTLQEGHHLVTDGPYSRLRHPRYLGIILFNIGIALVFRSVLALVFIAGLVCVLLWRIRDEEAMMSGVFGAEWDRYAGRSWRLIPFVY